MIELPWPGTTLEPTLALVILFVMTFVSNGLLPLPITAFVIWLGQFHYPVSVVLVGTLGSVLGWVCLSPWLRQWQQRVTKTPSRPPWRMQNSTQGLLWLTFLSNALPLPVDPGRYLALQSTVAPAYLTSVIAVGRALRMTILVSAGALLAPYQNWFWALVVFFIFFPLVMSGLNRWMTSRANPASDTE